MAPPGHEGGRGTGGQGCCCLVPASAAAFAAGSGVGPCKKFAVGAEISRLATGQLPAPGLEAVHEGFFFWPSHPTHPFRNRAADGQAWARRSVRCAGRRNVHSRKAGGVVTSQPIFFWVGGRGGKGGKVLLLQMEREGAGSGSPEGSLSYQSRPSIGPGQTQVQVPAPWLLAFADFPAEGFLCII